MKMHVQRSFTYELMHLPCDVYTVGLHSQSRLLNYIQLALYCFEGSLWTSFYFHEICSRFQPNGYKGFLTP